MSHLKISFVLAEEPVAIGQNRLDDSTLLAHVRDHGHHVVVRRSNERRPEHDGQVFDLHFVGVAVWDDVFEMPADEPERRKVDVGQTSNLAFQRLEPHQRVLNFGHVDEGGIQILEINAALVKV